MRMTKRARSGVVAVLAISSCVAASCAGDGPTTAAKGGFLTGTVTFLDETGVLLPDASGAVIHLEGADGSFHSATDANGSFAIGGLGNGPYDLTAERSGFGTVRAFGLEPGSDPVVLQLGALSSAAVLSLEASVNHACGTDPCVDLDFRARSVFPRDAGRRLFRLFVGSRRNVSPEDYDETFLLVLASDDPGIAQLEDDILVSLPAIRGILGPRYAAGTRLWLRLYGATENVASGWIDPVTSLRVFTDLSGTSATATIEAR